jgi:hypothetical protein
MIKRIDTGSPWPISNNPTGKYFNTRPQSVVGNGEYPLWQVVRASTAAPAFFAPESITIAKMPRAKAVAGKFIDGGVSPFNNPALMAVMYSTMAGIAFPANRRGQAVCRVGRHGCRGSPRDARERRKRSTVGHPNMSTLLFSSQPQPLDHFVYGLCWVLTNGVRGDTNFAWFLPVPSHVDNDLADQLLKTGIVSPHFLAAALAVDLEVPVLSDRRRSLLRFVPDRFDFMPIPAGTHPATLPRDAGRDFLITAVLQAIDMAYPPADLPADGKPAVVSGMEIPHIASRHIAWPLDFGRPGAPSCSPEGERGKRVGSLRALRERSSKASSAGARVRSQGILLVVRSGVVMVIPVLVGEPTAPGAADRESDAVENPRDRPIDEQRLPNPST